MGETVFSNNVPKYILVPKSDTTRIRAEQFLSKGQVMGKAKIRSLEVTFSGDLDNKQKEKLSQFYKVEENKKVSIKWHLDRVNQRVLPLDNRMFQSANANNVDIYVIDTGIDLSHPEFKNNNGVWGGNFVNDGINSDCNGHGTHVASLALGKDYGVAKNATLIALKVLGCDGSGWYSSIISAIEYATERSKTTNRLSIINMSLGGPSSSALNTAVSASIASGVYNVVAAGNENTNACTKSPAGVVQAITVAASDSSDRKAGFSNYGSCVDVYAPGVNLIAAWPGNRYATLSGTSMASPVAAGVLAVYLSRNGMSGIDLFYQQMTKGVIKSNPKRTVNQMVYIF